MTWKHYTFLGSAMICTALAVMPAIAVDDEILRHPIPSVAEFYQEQWSTVESLRQTVRDGANTETRLAAFEKLADEYPEAAEITAREHVDDSNDKVAAFAVGYLMNALVMTDHTHGASSGLPPRILYMMDVHGESKEALRKAVVDERETIREPVAQFLASQSDENALSMISNGVETGLYSETEAANLFTLARGSIGQKYLAKYIGSGDAGAQIAAIEYLGFFPEYQDRIRTTYFANSDAEIDARVEAANVLSKYDQNFAEYALIVAGQQDANPVLFSASMAGYVNALTAKNKLDRNSAKLIGEQIKRYVATPPTGISDETAKDLKILQERLESRSN